jgi:hypothetical protein
MFDRNLATDTVDGLLAAHRARLKGLIGATIDATWVAWNVGDDEWFADEAVIVEAGDVRLEIVCWKLSEIVLSWNAIDLSEPPRWVADWGRGFSLQWRRDATPVLRDAVGRAILGINIVECLHRMTVVQDRRNPTAVGRQHEAWLLHGLEFELQGSTLGVFNALDENGVGTEPFAGPEFRRVPV